MPKGRNPIPTAVKRLRGNPGKRPLNDNEPQPERSMPDPPGWLKGVGLEEWNRQAPELFRLGLLTIIDGAALGAYCQAYADVDAAIAASALAPVKGGKINPHRRLADMAWKQMRTWAAAFGLDPSDRVKLSAGTAAPKDALEDYLAGPKLAKKSG